MSGCCDPGGYKREFGAPTARRNAKAYRKSGLVPTARALVDGLRARGLEGVSVLEVGGGVGGIQLELLRSGAARSTNVELSSEYEAVALELAREAGVSERIERRLGDIVDLAPSIEPADVVVLHRVVCCYPYLAPLLRAAADRARRSLALTYPRRTIAVRVYFALGNLWFWLTRNTFRAFVHPPREIERIAADRGLRPSFRKADLIWESVVFERP